MAAEARARSHPERLCADRLHLCDESWSGPWVLYRSPWVLGLRRRAALLPWANGDAHGLQGPRRRSRRALSAAVLSGHVPNHLGPALQDPTRVLG